MDLSSHKIDVHGESKDVLCSEQELLAWMDCIYQEYTCIKEESNAWFISIAFISKEEMQDLNKSFTGEDRPTNVLSFPNDLNIRNEMGLGEVYPSGNRYQITRINLSSGQQVNEGDLLFVIKPLIEEEEAA